MSAHKVTSFYRQALSALPFSSLMSRQGGCLVFTAMLMLGGCATSSLPEALPPEPDTAQEQASTPEPESPFDAPLPDIEYGHFDQDILARVILAEMAGQRGMNAEALESYMSLARDTRDIGIIQRASRIATFMRNPLAAAEMSRLWLEVQPDSAEAYQTLAGQMLAMSRYGEALDAMTTLLEMDLPPDFRLVAQRLQVDNDAGLYRDGLLADLDQLSARFPENQSLRLARAQLHEQNGETEAALALVSELSAEMGRPADMLLLESGMLKDLGRTGEAMKKLREGIALYPDDVQLRFQYGRELVSLRDFDAAREEFATIVELDPADYDMLYSLALINLEMNHFREAQPLLERLVKVGHRLDDSHYYLAFIHNQYNETEAAIDHYMQVDGGNNFMQAQVDLSELLIHAGRYSELRRRLQRLRYTSPVYNQPLLLVEASVLVDSGMNREASSVLDSALSSFPDNVELLYLRSVLSTNTNNLPLMEQDLRRMIELNPDDARAYNSLGYILADRTDRIDEAYDLILKAVALEPEDPAIIDSLGWVQFRLGLLNEARSNLEKAYRLFPDHEVAAHLGEVMWVMGDRRDASNLWQEALQRTPDSHFIREAMERLIPASGS